MPSHHTQDLNAALYQLLGELEGYASHIQQLARESQSRQDVVLFGQPCQAMDRMRALAVPVPQLSAQWVLMMISHTELMHNLWRAAKGEALDVATELEDHLAAVTGLAAHCRRLLVQGGPVLH